MCTNNVAVVVISELLERTDFVPNTPMSIQVNGFHLKQGNRGSHELTEFCQAALTVL